MQHPIAWGSDFTPSIFFELQNRWVSAPRPKLSHRRRAAVLDGIDEAAGRREEIGSLVREELVPLGFRVVATSRPEGVRAGACLSQQWCPLSCK